MHGRKRVAGGVPPEQAAATAKKLEAYRKLAAVAFKHVRGWAIHGLAGCPGRACRCQLASARQLRT